MIAEIMPAEAEKEEMSSDDLLAVIDSLSNRVSALESERTELSAQLADATQSKDAVTTELANTKTELSALKKAPAAPSVRENFNRVAVREAVKKESVSEMMERLRSNK
jgi:phage shock protein A